MKKVVLLGDSIRQCYAPKVIELLGNDITVWQPEENCRFAHYTLRLISDNRKNIEGADVIHWNNGLWDNCRVLEDGNFTEINDYVKEMVRIGKLLLKLGKKVIFATTTPANPKYPYHINSETEAYNAAVIPPLKALGVEINDLYAVVLPHIDEYIRDDMLHLSAAGIDACAAQVAKSIRAAF